MTTTLKDIPAEEVSTLLADKGIDPRKPVTVLVDESLSDIAERINKEAKARGLTPELYKEIMEDLS